MLLRPADANETVEAWKIAVAHTDGPVGLVFTRQKLPTLDRSTLASGAGSAKGAYVLATALQVAQAHPPRYRFRSVDRAQGAQPTDS
jgi:transketolase